MTLLTMVMRWPGCTFNFCALIGQNLTGDCGKFMQHLDTCFMSSCDGFNYFFHWMYKMKYSCYKILLLFMAGLFITFLIEKLSEIIRSRSR